MGADSICIKDMAGVLTPEDATELVTALKRNVSYHWSYTRIAQQVFVK